MVVSHPNVPVVNAGSLYINGLQLSWLAGVVSVSAGSCRDSSNVDDILLQSSVSIALNVYGANGVDINAYNPSTPGKLYVNSFYHVYLIGDSKGYQPTAAMLSLDLVPNQPSPPSVVGVLSLPLGYDMYRRVGTLFTDNGATPAIIGFSQYGNGNSRTIWYYNLLRAFSYSAGASPTVFTANEIGQGVPSGPEAYEAWMIVDYTPTAAANFIQMSPFAANPSGTGMIKFGCGGAGALQNNVLLVPTSPDAAGYPSVFYESSAAGDSVTVSVVGYKDYL